MGNRIFAHRKREYYANYNTSNYVRCFMNYCRSVFAPSCVAHTVLTRRDWRTIKIDSVSLPSALHCWHTETNFAKFSNNNKAQRPIGRTNVAGNRRLTRNKARSTEIEENYAFKKKKQTLRRKINQSKGKCVVTGVGIFFFFHFKI